MQIRPPIKMPVALRPAVGAGRGRLGILPVVSFATVAIDAARRNGPGCGRATVPALEYPVPANAVPAVAGSYCCNRDAGAANSAVLSVRPRGTAGNSLHGVH